MMLSAFLMYCYSILAANYFFSTIVFNAPAAGGGSPTGPIQCQQLWECLMFTINYGLRNGGGISDSTNPRDPLNDTTGYVSKFFFDILFFMLINVISLNVIFGIIIDTFSSMREEGEAKSKQLDSNLQKIIMRTSALYALSKEMSSNSSDNPSKLISRTLTSSGSIATIWCICTTKARTTKQDSKVKYTKPISKSKRQCSRPRSLKMKKKARIPTLKRKEFSPKLRNSMVRCQ